MTNTLTILIRLLLPAWIGAALLFVLVNVLQVTSGQFTTETTDKLVLLRFPPFYLMGTIILTVTTKASLVLSVSLRKRVQKLWIAITILLASSLALMMADYFFIYWPLTEMITPPGSPRPANFKSYHQASEAINTLGLLLVMIATALAHYPSKKSGPTMLTRNS